MGKWKWKTARKRRDEWFRTMFVKLFAEWHEVTEEPKKGLFLYSLLRSWDGLPVSKPKAKHEDYKGLAARLEAVEKKVCDHVFGDPSKGCVEAIVCSKCGTIHPDWEPDRRRKYDDNDDIMEGWTPPKYFVNGTGYVRKEENPRRG